MLMVATPVFYRVSDLPDGLQSLAYLNPLATSIETARAVLLGDPFPPAALYLGLVFVALAVFRGGFAVFERYKGILVDVI